MTRTWFATELETVAMFWRVMRRDGYAHGFTTHDKDLWFEGVSHLASPGMVPSTIRRSADFEPDSAEVEGALAHEAITALDLAEGRYDGARVRIGVVDWESLESATLYYGTIGEVSEEDGRFSAQLHSRKIELLTDPVPRTSPGCRAEFCGPGCNLNPLFHTIEARLASRDLAANAIVLAGSPAPEPFIGGTVRWLDGPHAGTTMQIVRSTDTGALVLDQPLLASLAGGAAAVVREGCDHTLDTCATRFANAANFRGEPFLPGNDLLTRYPAPHR